MFIPKLDHYKGECMVFIINNNNGINELIHGYQVCHSNQILIFGGYMKVTKYVYSRVIIWVNTILNYIDNRMILPRSEGSCMVYILEWY